MFKLLHFKETYKYKSRDNYSQLLGICYFYIRQLNRIIFSCLTNEILYEK